MGTRSEKEGGWRGKIRSGTSERWVKVISKSDETKNRGARGKWWRRGWGVGDSGRRGAHSALAMMHGAPAARRGG
jgi:hypothetical protein